MTAGAPSTAVRGGADKELRRGCEMVMVLSWLRLVVKAQSFGAGIGGRLAS